MENIIKTDEIIKNFDCENIIIKMENNIDNYLNNANDYSIKR